MPFDWRDFLEVAYDLRSDNRESFQRTSLGRAYYYVYNLGLIKAKTLNFRRVPGLGGTHKQLWGWYESQNDPIIRRLGIEGNRMYAKRIPADYIDAPIQNIAREVEIQLTRARTFETLMAKVDGQAPPPALP